MQTVPKDVSSVIQEFSRFAHQYDKYNIIQAKVASSLIDKLDKLEYENIFDLGCGSGELYKNIQKKGIDFQSFTALDSSKNMLKLHPNDERINKVCVDFNHVNFLDHLSLGPSDLVISSSALQWSTNLENLMKSISPKVNTLYAALFTSNTFKTLHQCASLSSPIYSAKSIQNAVNKFYNHVSYELQEYRLEFNSTREMFQYIKQSGVSSGERKLSYKETKALLHKYPLSYLEFEVLFIKAKGGKS